MKSVLDRAVEYAKDVINKKEEAPFEVIKQCEFFFEDLKRSEDEDFEFYFDTEEVNKISNLTKLMNFATGIDVVGKSIHDGLVGFQCFFIANVFGWRFKENPERFRYRTNTLFIPRKNAKTFLCAVILILLMLTEQMYSEFYSICVDRTLAVEIKKAMTQIIESSPLIAKHFTVSKQLSGKIECNITKCFYQARTSESSKNNSIRPSGFVADEIGAFTTKDNINAMKSGQRNVNNALTFQLTTAYAEDNSIMLEELEYLKKLYRGIIKEPRVFALLYYSPEEYLWEDKGLYMSNPLRIEDNYEEIRQARKDALEKPSEREEYLTKSMNHFVPSNNGEEFISIDQLRKCRIKDFDWSGREVWLGLDLAQTTDNCGVSMVTEEDGNIIGTSWCFIPGERVQEKSKNEDENYKYHISKGTCFACGDFVVDYKFIEDFILDIENKFNVQVNKIGYDRYNALSSAQKFESEGYDTVEVKQVSGVLHPPTKLLKEHILNKTFMYTTNNLMEINFRNARIMEDSNRNMWLHKKKAKGKIDMLASMINAIYLMQQDVLFNEETNWAIQI